MNTSAGHSASAVLRRSVAVTNLFLHKNLWIWPLFAALVLAAVAYWLRAHVEQAMKSSLADQLQVILAADVAALEQWLVTQRSNAQTAAASQTRAELAGKLIALAEREDTSPLTLVQSPELAAIKKSRKPWMDAHGYIDFIITDRRRRIVGAGQPDLIGKENLPRYREFLDAALAGEATVSRPFPSLVLLADENGELRADVPTMFAAAPLRDRDDQVVGVLAFRLRPEQDFTRILNVAHFGRSGETYAFDADGLMLSNSRFDDELKRMGLLPDREGSHSILNLQLRDPLVNLNRGERPSLRRSELPLTRMAADAVQGRSGVDVDGYRDYRGVPNVGAWTWLPGLVKAVGGERAVSLSVAGVVTGTPLYLSPEAVQHPDDLDPRSDLYAVGAVGYFLLTGTPVFKAKSVLDLLMHHVNTPPDPPSQRLGKFISTDLEAIVLNCLAKRRDDRPATAQDLAAALAGCTSAGDWTEADAAAWWAAHAHTSSSHVLLAETAATEVPSGGETAVWTRSEK